MLTRKSFGGRSIEAPVERIEEVLGSEFFLRLSIGSWTEGQFLWRHLLDLTDLPGDPLSWQFVEHHDDNSDSSSIGIRQDNETTWIKRDSIFGQPDPFTIHLSKSDEEFFQLRVSKTFFAYQYFVKRVNLAPVENFRRIAYLTRKSDAFKRQPHSRIEWAFASVSPSAARVEVETRGEHTNNAHAFMLLNLLESVATTGDLTEVRATQIKERARREKELRDREIKEAEEKRKSLEQQRIRRCVSEDRCLRCEEPVVQRRNRRTTELFFGCSQFGNRKCTATRRITCPNCNQLMVEKTKRTGGTFLGCSGWPRCNGGRQIDDSLELEKWKKRQEMERRASLYDPSIPTLDELAREWGWANWAAFDDSRE